MRLFLALIASFFLCSAPSAACSMKEGYKVPTNFELVQKAKVIVLARVESVPAFHQADAGNAVSQTASLKPLRFLKGRAADGELRVMGWRPPKNWQGVPTATTLWQSHFSAGLGACVRQFYEPGELVVAMFDADPRMKQITGQELNQLFDAWARVVETVDGPDAVWVRAVERYVDLQAGDRSTMRQRIEAQIHQLRSVATPEAQAIAADLDYYLRRGDRSGTWGTIAMPTFTAAGVDGQKGAQLYCVAGTPPGVMVKAGKSPDPLRLVADGVPYVTKATPPSPVEQIILDASAARPGDTGKPQALTTYRLSDPATLNALRSAAKDVRIEIGGRTIINGGPLDALLRWVSQCEKLQALPAPTEQELRN